MKMKQIKVISKSTFNKRRRLAVKTLLHNGKFVDASALGTNRNKEQSKYFGANVV